MARKRKYGCCSKTAFGKETGGDVAIFQHDNLGLSLIVCLLPGVFVMGAYVIYRLVGSRAAWKAYRDQLPPASQLSWFMNGSADSTNPSLASENHSPQYAPTDNPSERPQAALRTDATEARHRGIGALLAAAADGGILGMSIANAFQSIDPNVLQAIQSSTADHIHGLADIHTYVNDHFFNAPGITAEGWLHRLEGYVAEHKAAAALEHAGHQVVFAHTPNQPVWDMLVDGHPVQVKEGLHSLVEVKQFLLQHHGVDVITGTDVADHMHHVMVHGLHALDPASIAQTTNDSLDGLQEGFDPGFHVPIITLVLSSYREIRLLVQQETAIETAAMHVLMDVAGVGGGSLLGGHTGALAGAVVMGPLGAAIGGFVGAVLGAVAGKSVSTAVRCADFAAALETYKATIAEARSDVENSVQTCQSRVAALRDYYGDLYHEKRELILASTSNSLRSVSDFYASEVQAFTDAFPTRLTLLLAQLEHEEEHVLSCVPRRGWRATVLPGRSEAFHVASKMWFRRARHIIGHEKRVYQKIKRADRDARFEHIRGFLQSYSLRLDAFWEATRRLSIACKEAQIASKELRDVAVDNANRERDRLIRQFAMAAIGEQENLGEIMNNWAAQIKGAKDNLEEEARRVGKRMPV